METRQEDIVAELAQARRAPATPREAGAVCAFQRARLSAAMEAAPGILRRMLVG
ncbi:hypothetical protein [Staphylococcus pseudintermedius]|uniref:hypothetical protein n=1 Tax=Staphylococcus pseudintermedius TaxID=283734 RepID=UPI0015F298B1|nr:hypothetical protein [Staphylococcus pseudintermedius]